MARHIRYEYDAYGMTPDARAAEIEEILEQGARRRRRRFWTIILVIALLVLIGALVALGVIGYSYIQGQQKYDKISDIADVGMESNAAARVEDIASIEVDWDALRAANPDTVAWVYIPHTVINYPVVKGEDNDHYLYYDFDGEAGWLANYGAIFMDYRNKPKWRDEAYFIYGHHMNDGSMFADIAGMEDQARFDECRTVFLLSPEGNFRLRTFAIVHSAPDELLVQTVFKDDKERTEYIQDKMDRSLAKVDDVPAAKDIDQVFVFATCDAGSWGRDVLFAYVEETSVEGLEGLEGRIGIGKNSEGVKEFVEDVKETS